MLLVSSLLLNVLGLDANGQHSMVDWDTFLKLYCIFEVGNIEKDRLVTFWTKFFDTKNLGFCKEEEYMDVLEKLVRGKIYGEKNQFTTLYSLIYRSKLAAAGCLGPNGEIIIEKLREAYQSG